MVDSFSAANARDACSTYLSTGERASTTLSRRFCCRWPISIPELSLSTAEWLIDGDICRVRHKFTELMERDIWRAVMEPPTGASGGNFVHLVRMTSNTSFNFIYSRVSVIPHICVFSLYVMGVYNANCHCHYYRHFIASHVYCTEIVAVAVNSIINNHN